MLSPPALSDKLIDWRLIEQAGGQELLHGKDVIDFGPSYGLDMIMWSFWTKSYTIVESDDGVMDHIHRLRMCFSERTIIRLKHNLLRRLPDVLVPEDSSYDIVIDFGTIDNVMAGFEPYREAWRVLRPGGRLFTTFANLDYFKESLSEAKDEHRFAPADLIELFKSMGGLVTTAMNGDQPRAGLVAKKL